MPSSSYSTRSRRDGDRGSSHHSSRTTRSTRSSRPHRSQRGADSDYYPYTRSSRRNEPEAPPHTRSDTTRSDAASTRTRARTVDRSTTSNAPLPESGGQLRKKFASFAADVIRTGIHKVLRPLEYEIPSGPIRVVNRELLHKIIDRNDEDHYLNIRTGDHLEILRKEWESYPEYNDATMRDSISKEALAHMHKLLREKEKFQHVA